MRYDDRWGADGDAHLYELEGHEEVQVQRDANSKEVVDLCTDQRRFCGQWGQAQQYEHSRPRSLLHQL